MTVSVLDGVAGLGQRRATALLDTFGSVGGIADATSDQLLAVPGMGPKTVTAVIDALRAAGWIPQEEVTDA